MSTAINALPVPRRRPDAPRRLRAIEAPGVRRRPRLAYGIIAVAGAVVIGAAQMALSILTTQGSFELSELRQQQRELALSTHVLQDDLAGLSSPQYLAANAGALGMVIEQAPNYLRLSDGVVLGAQGVPVGLSSIDAIGRGSVPNALISETPLVTDPDATIEGAPVATDDAAGGGASNTPLPLTDGLPTPSTH